MSQHRIAPYAGYYKPNGKCRWCKGDVPPRRTFCSDECIHQHKLRTRPCYVRNEVWKRDRGVCAACGLDTTALRVSMQLNEFRRTKEQVERLESLGFKRNAIYPGDFWQADHVVEVVKGGGGCGLENYQTLCTPCHKVKTKRLARERAEQRRIAAEQAKMSLFAGIEP